MFKKIRENEKVQKIKELWKNPKTHSLIVLAFWLIFIIIVIAFVRVTTSSTTNTEYQNNLNSFSTINSYDFRYKTNDLEINGKYYNEAIVFYLNNKQYYYKDKVYLIDDEIKTLEDYDLNVLKITSKFLNNLTSGITPSDNGFKQYIVPLDRFINLYEYDTALDLSKATTYNVIVNVYYKDDEINKVVLDLSSYYTFKEGKEISYPVTIYYYNLNNISDFTRGYQKIVEVKS